MRRTIRVAILINDPYLNIIKPLYDALLKDNRFTVKTWACRRVGYDFSPGVPAIDISALCTSQNIAHELEPTLETIAAFGADFIFTSNPYDMYLDPQLDSALLSRHARLMNISYGAALVEWVDEYEVLKNNPYILRVYRVYIESPLIFRTRSNFKSVGYAKLEEYMNGTRPVKKFALPAIAWKPRWTGQDEVKLMKLISEFKSLTDRYIINLVIHPFLFSNITGETGESLNEFIEGKNVNAVTGHDFLDYVLGSDIYIGDISSTLAEFAWTGRPIIYTGTYKNLSTLGRYVINSTYRSVEGDIQSLIKALEAGEDPLSRERVGLFDKLFPTVSGSPIEAILNDMLEIGKLKQMLN